MIPADLLQEHDEIVLIVDSRPVRAYVEGVSTAEAGWLNVRARRSDSSIRHDVRVRPEQEMIQI